MICPHCGYDNLPGSEECRKCSTPLTQLDVPVPINRVEQSLMEDAVVVLQPKAAVTVAASSTVRQVVQTMLERDIGAVLVVDDAGCLVGIFSERDLLSKVLNGHTENLDRPVEYFMTPKPETVTVDKTLAFALRAMATGGYRHLPVVVGEKDCVAVGVISVRDMLRHITRLCKCR
jgi:CBS domain-containing protein